MLTHEVHLILLGPARARQESKDGKIVERL